MDYKTKYLKLNYNGCSKISEDNLQNPIFIIDGTGNTDDGNIESSPIIIMWDNPYYGIIKKTYNNLKFMDNTINDRAPMENTLRWESRFCEKKSFRQGNNLFIVSNDNYTIDESTYNIVMCINLDTGDIKDYQMVVVFEADIPTGYLKHRRFFLFENKK
jgi:hypothetical protein